MKRFALFLVIFTIIINPAVLHQFYADGGRISIARYIVIDGQQCWGGYYWDTNLIRITPDAPETTLPHEIGHYLYHKQVWSGELQNRANAAFASSPLRVCNDENFACGYAMYCTGRLGGKLADFYKEIEDGIS